MNSSSNNTGENIVFLNMAPLISFQGNTIPSTATALSDTSTLALGSHALPKGTQTTLDGWVIRTPRRLLRRRRRVLAPVHRRLRQITLDGWVIRTPRSSLRRRRRRRRLRQTSTPRL